MRGPSSCHEKGYPAKKIKETVELEYKRCGGAMTEILSAAVVILASRHRRPWPGWAVTKGWVLSNPIK